MDARKSAIIYFNLKILSLGKFGTKIQNCLLELKFGTWHKVCLKKSDTWAKKLNNVLPTKIMNLIFVLMCKY